MKISGKGHIVTVAFYVPTESIERAVEEAEAIVAEINEYKAITIYEDGGGYFGFAEIGGIEVREFDYDEDGMVIGTHA